MLRISFSTSISLVDITRLQVLHNTKIEYNTSSFFLSY
jgi:hypothetical protein